MSTYLLLYDEYDGYLAQEKVYRSSPYFKTLEEAEAYALEHWVAEKID
ncbi:MAG: hypothetical protein MK212_12925 [Saprospiraceae bacterium]|nr:hypothetical protein [Saprospiraceae bacterium]